MLIYVLFYGFRILAVTFTLIAIFLIGMYCGDKFAKEEEK